jgi:hypothetical protein
MRRYKLVGKQALQELCVTEKYDTNNSMDSCKFGLKSGEQELQSLGAMANNAMRHYFGS